MNAQILYSTATQNISRPLNRSDFETIYKIFIYHSNQPTYFIQKEVVQIETGFCQQSKWRFLLCLGVTSTVWWKLWTIYKSTHNWSQSLGFSVTNWTKGWDLPPVLHPACHAAGQCTSRRHLFSYPSSSRTMLTLWLSLPVPHASRPLFPSSRVQQKTLGTSACGRHDQRWGAHLHWLQY
jgi:hypothetical protein